MKFIFLVGGATGFVSGGAASMYAAHSADRVLLDGAVGCLTGALLFRWFWTILVGGIRETILVRHAAASAAAAATKATPPPSAAVAAKK